MLQTRELAVNSSRPNVLVIEKVASIAKTVCQGLENTSLRPFAVPSCGAAQRLLDDGAVELVLLRRQEFTQCRRGPSCVLRTSRQVVKIPIDRLLVENEGHWQPGPGTSRLRDFALGLERFLRCATDLRTITRCEGNDVVLDHVASRVTHKGREIPLSPTQFRLLAFFMDNPDKVYSRGELIEHVWNDRDRIGRNVDIHVAWLRRALADRRSNMIRTVRGEGYQFCSRSRGKRSGRSAARGAIDTVSSAHSLGELSAQFVRQLDGLGIRPRALLELFLLNPDMTFSRERLADLIWGPGKIDLRTIDVTVGRLRKAFIRRALPDPVRSVLGKGYQIAEPWHAASVVGP